MVKPAIDGVIFDCDETLVDSETIGNEVLVDHVAEFGLTMPIEEAVALFTGGKMSRAVAQLERRLEKPLPGLPIPGGYRPMIPIFQCCVWMTIFE